LRAIGVKLREWILLVTPRRLVSIVVALRAIAALRGENGSYTTIPNLAVGACSGAIYRECA